MTTPYYKDATITLHHGDCLDVLHSLPDASVDSIVTDPPYGLGFMGREWDALPPGLPWARECLRVLKPGGHLLAFGGTRTWHRLAVAMEDGGFEVRDSIAWMYGSGFPKSMDVSKAIDKAAGAEREVLSETFHRSQSSSGGILNRVDVPRVIRETEPATPEAEQWEGWGTALKPAFEPIVVGRKPLVGTVAANVLAHGTGALNIDATRIAHDGSGVWGNAQNPDAHASALGYMGGEVGRVSSRHDAGRWPANVILDESQAEALDEQSGESRDGVAVNRNRGDERPMEVAGTPRRVLHDDHGFGGGGGASRFFYVAKADASERVRVDGIAHPTVKPLTLMRWLVRLVTPPGGTVLEPFAGSGTTVEACLLEGFRCIAIERESEYLPLIEQRINRRRDPVAAVKGAGLDDLGLFDLLGDEAS